jgi:hypothetical protein
LLGNAKKVKVINYFGCSQRWKMDEYLTEKYEIMIKGGHFVIEVYSRSSPSAGSKRTIIIKGQQLILSYPCI